MRPRISAEQLELWTGIARLALIQLGGWLTPQRLARETNLALSEARLALQRLAATRQAAVDVRGHYKLASYITADEWLVEARKFAEQIHSAQDAFSAWFAIIPKDEDHETTISLADRSLAGVPGRAG